MKIKIFVHLTDLPKSQSVAEEILEKLIISDLIDNAETEFYCNYKLDNFKWLEERIKNYPNASIVNLNATPEEYELPTLNELKKFCDLSKEEYYILYIHHKGASRVGKKGYPGIPDWRKLMLYFNVERWKDAVEKLDQNFDTVGALWSRKKFDHYSGNFWWAKSSYIKKLPFIERPVNLNYQQEPQFNHSLHYRFDAECWIGLSNPNYYSFHDVDHDFYKIPYSEELYRK
jgi:hypothetical protein